MSLATIDKMVRSFMDRKEAVAKAIEQEIAKYAIREMRKHKHLKSFRTTIHTWGFYDENEEQIEHECEEIDKLILDHDEFFSICASEILVTYKTND